ncbi:hypothetical protein [Chitinophaga silvatica]|uniref:hypothetical protein n=1 Tax=Chitinophaga silvatica TaxID=2282649 RepID=UPI0011C0D381|nr:hypothetical protein [Chitinophaga silvatica]
MNKRRWHKILSIILLGVFTLNTLPREFIHEFAGHHDTVDAWHHEGAALSELHQHCDFLQIAIEPYEPIAAFYFVLAQPIKWEYPVLKVVNANKPFQRFSSPRAPPAII